MKAAIERWETLFLSDERLQTLLDRVHFLRRQNQNEQEPPPDLLPTLTRDAALSEMIFGETQLRQALAKPIGEILLRHLPRELSQNLEKLAPESVMVPSGTRIRIQYPRERNPFIEVRIQELFGWRETPCVGPARIPITLHLLGPNYRPVQVTADLASFWKQGYAEVRKELRIRYPKHSWPEDPLTAQAEAKGRPRRT